MECNKKKNRKAKAGIGKKERKKQTNKQTKKSLGRKK